MVSNKEITILQISNCKFHTVKISDECVFIDAILIENNLYLIEYNIHKSIYLVRDTLTNLFEYNHQDDVVTIINYVPQKLISLILQSLNCNTEASYEDFYAYTDYNSGYTNLYIKKGNKNICSLKFNHIKIHKAIIYNSEYIYIHLSTPYIQPSLYFLKISNLETSLNNIIHGNKNLEIYHIEDQSTQLKYLKYLPSDSKQKFVVFLHGGPYFHFDFSYCFISNELLKKGFKIFKLNPYGSTGYTLSYKEKIYQKAGILDYKQVINFLKVLNTNYPNSPIYLLGDSYGAYLCSLIAFSKNINLTKILCISPFTDIKYQLLFSNSIILMNELFSKLNINDINPQFLAKNNKIQHSLTIIHGLKDQNCPYQQISNFKNEIKLSEGKKLKVITYFDYQHYPESITMRTELNKKVLEELLYE